METPAYQPNGSLLNDRDLLRRFVLDDDETAFAEIVQRYQSLVMGICRQVIGDAPDVDDAFQATFLALARRPRSIRNTGCLSSWLYKVAWRTSLRLIRVRRKEALVSLEQHLPGKDVDQLDRIASAQDCLVLNEELDRLPQKYRDVLVMTYFAGQSNQQIADQLSVSKGTVDGRIREARNVLRVRLARRGVAIAAIALAVGKCTSVGAAPSAALLTSTVELGIQTLNGSLPGTFDLSHLESLMNTKTFAVSSKTLVTCAACLALLVGAAGASLLNDVEAGDENGARLDQRTTTTLVVNEGEKTETVIVSSDGSATTKDGAKWQGAVPPSLLRALRGPLSTIRPDESDGRFSVAAHNDPPVEKWLKETLDRPVPRLEFPGEVSIAALLETIATHFTNEYGKQEGRQLSMTFWPDIAELDLEGIASLEDVFVRDINFEGLRLRNALKLIFDMTTEPELSYVIQNEVIMVTTLAKAQSDDNVVTRAYRVGELAVINVTPRDEEALVELKPDLVTVLTELSGAKWAHPGDEGGTMRLVGQTLIVRHSANVHREIVGLLNMLALAEAPSVE